MKEFMLNQAGQLSKFGNILPEKIEPMHQSQGAADLAFAGENLAENFPRLPSVTKRMSDETDLATKKIGQLRCRFEMTSLGDLDHPHHLGRIFPEDIAAADVDLAILNEKRSYPFGGSSRSREKEKERQRFCGRITARELRGDSLRHAKNISGMGVNVFHQRLASEQAAFFWISQPLRDCFLHVQVQRVGRALVQVMQLGSNPQ